MANFRGKGGSGAIDGFMFALSLVPTVMFALAMITVFEHYGALKAARALVREPKGFHSLDDLLFNTNGTH